MEVLEHTPRTITVKITKLLDDDMLAQVTSTNQEREQNT